MIWEMELIEKRQDYILKIGITGEHLSNAVEGVEKDLKLWEDWLTKGDLGVELKRDLKILIREMNIKWKLIKKK